MSDTDTTLATRPVISDEELSAIQSFEDAARLANDTGNLINAAEDIGTGFAVVDKDLLVGVEFIMVNARKNVDNATGRPFWTLHCVTKDGRKVIINDGSTGIAQQLDVLGQKRANVFPMYVPKGLRKSEYTTMILNRQGKEEPTQATTFYLSSDR